LKGKFWTPITSLFVHANFVHLIGNMLFLHSFGNTLEETLETRKIVSAFLVGGICSFVFSSVLYGLDVNMVGASAAIFTLAALVMFTKPLKFSFLFFMPLGLVAFLYFLYNLLAAFYVMDGNIGYVGHVIGFLFGIPFGIAWNRKRWHKNLLVTVLLSILYFALMSILKSY
jgi:membrane associated rhomboid family serine protease